MSREAETLCSPSIVCAILCACDISGASRLLLYNIRTRPRPPTRTNEPSPSTFHRGLVCIRKTHLPTYYMPQSSVASTEGPERGTPPPRPAAQDRFPPFRLMRDPWVYAAAVRERGWDMNKPVRSSEAFIRKSILYLPSPNIRSVHPSNPYCIASTLSQLSVRSSELPPSTLSSKQATKTSRCNSSALLLCPSSAPLDLCGIASSTRIPSSPHAPPPPQFATRSTSPRPSTRIPKTRSSTSLHQPP